MPIKIVKTQIIIEGEDIKLISDGLELGRRYIAEHKTFSGIGEFSKVDVDRIIEATQRYWDK